jgi:hypothetical protein
MIKHKIFLALVSINQHLQKLRDTILPKKRYRIPSDISIREFFSLLQEEKIHYIVLRWFESLPDLKPGDDIDILVSDEDFPRLVTLLKLSRKGIPCDLYSETAQGGGLYKNKTAYFNESLARDLLSNRTWQQNISVPNKKLYFYSLAYHAIYQKGVKSGIPSELENLPVSKNPKHDFTTILNELAEQSGITTRITMESLHQTLEKVGYGITADGIDKLQTQNPWMQAFFNRKDSIS